LNLLSVFPIPQLCSWDQLALTKDDPGTTQPLHLLLEGESDEDIRQSKGDDCEQAFILHTKGGEAMHVLISFFASRSFFPFFSSSLTAAIFIYLFFLFLYGITGRFLLAAMASSPTTGAASLRDAAIVGTSGSTTSTLGWVDPPAALELTQVHYLIRHGERTPVRTRLLKSTPPVPARWNMCHAGKDFRAAVLDLGEGSEVQATNWEGETFQGVRKDMSIKRRVEATDEREKILPVASGEW
jgi:hypothetical protein